MYEHALASPGTGLVRIECHILTDTASVPVANNFWGKEDAGVQPLLERMANAKQTCDELRSFYAGMTPTTSIPLPSALFTHTDVPHSTIVYRG